MAQNARFPAETRPEKPQFLTARSSNLFASLKEDIRIYLSAIGASITRHSGRKFVQETKIMKLTKLAVVAALVASTSAFAQDNDVIDADVDASTDVVDSFDDNSDTFVDSFDDNSDRVFEDSFDDNSQDFSSGVGINNNSTFGDNAIVAETTLSNVVTGVDVNYGDLQDSADFENRLSNYGNAFQNYSGMNALNQNTGTGASQNASVTIAVSSANSDVN